MAQAIVQVIYPIVWDIILELHQRLVANVITNSHLPSYLWTEVSLTHGKTLHLNIVMQSCKISVWAQRIFH